MSQLGVYIHIPFCLSKCPYCNFNSSVVSSLPEDKYVEALLSEIRFTSKGHFSEYEMVDTIYFGGGTPSLFSPSSVGKVLDVIATCYSFSDDIEITLEANPGSLDTKKLKGFSDLGIKRLNLGFQSLKDHLLQKLGRIHTAKEASEAFSLARKAGFYNLGVDLIYGIPGQETVELREDLEAVIRLKPEHIAAYNLTVEPDTPFSHWVEQGMITLPTEEQEVKMYELTHRMLTDAGYDHYEISNFGLPGYQSRHNQKYWVLEPYMGVGAGAHSYKRTGGSGTRWWNVSDPYRYIDDVENNRSSITGNERLSEKETYQEALFLGLRQLKGINLSDLKSDFGMSLDKTYPGVVPGLVDVGLLDLEQDTLKLTSQGILLSDEVFQNFF